MSRVSARVAPLSATHVFQKTLKKRPRLLSLSRGPSRLQYNQEDRNTTGCVRSSTVQGSPRIERAFFLLCYGLLWIFPDGIPYCMRAESGSNWHAGVCHCMLTWPLDRHCHPADQSAVALLMLLPWQHTGGSDTGYLTDTNTKEVTVYTLMLWQNYYLHSKYMV